MNHFICHGCLSMLPPDAREELTIGHMGRFTCQVCDKPGLLQAATGAVVRRAVIDTVFLAYSVELKKAELRAREGLASAGFTKIKN